MSIRQWPEKTEKFLKEVKVEMQKVSWPNRQMVAASTISVLVAVVALSIMLWGIDAVYAFFLKIILEASGQG
ncbi:MAG: preprotein translocase subunit SecE [Candidatus Sumerlaeota bacterium]|nr:preprotein translocase subunit SecE [Candidatus Sumerlaeota bacterium]